MRLKSWSTCAAVISVALICAYAIPATRETLRAAIFTLVGPARIGSSGGIRSSYDMTWDSPSEKIASLRPGVDGHLLLGLTVLNCSATDRAHLAAIAAASRPMTRETCLTLIYATHSDLWFDASIGQPKRVTRTTAQSMIYARQAVEWGMRNDPNNAVFPLIDATLALRRGDTVLAQRRIAAADKCAAYDTYRDTVFRAEGVMLESMGTPKLIVPKVMADNPMPDALYMMTGPTIFSTLDTARSLEARGLNADALKLRFRVYRISERMSKGSSHLASGSWALRAFEFRRRRRLTPDGYLYASMADLRAHGASEAQVARVRAGTLSMIADGRAAIADYDRYTRTLQTTVFPMCLASALWCFALFGALALVVRKVLGGETRVAGWSLSTSVILWILLLAPLAPALARGDLQEVARDLLIVWNPRYGLIPGLIAGPLAVASVFIAGTWLRKRLARLAPESQALPWIIAFGVLLPVWIAMLITYGSGRRGTPVVAMAEIAPIALFAVVRSLIVHRRSPGREWSTEFVTSLQASFSSVSIGSIVLFLVGIYVSAPAVAAALRSFWEYAVSHVYLL